MSAVDAELVALGALLAQRRAALLRAWRQAVAADDRLTTCAALPRRELHDHIPALLADFEARLVAGSAEDVARETAPQADAAAHGLHRWQQGFDLSEVSRELGRLNECMVDALEQHARSAAAPSAEAMGAARRLWAQLYCVAVSASTAAYDKLRQIESAGQIEALERALDSVRELERQRAHLWQQAAHDLRGNLGVVANATAGLSAARASPMASDRFLRLLDRNVGSLHALLDDVTSLARLQGGQEQRRVAALDAAAVLAELCEALRPQAVERRLFLHTQGPTALPVQGDAVKVRRIAQNLVLNAIRYTRTGGVTVHWGEPAAPDDGRWFVEVADTGPGLQIAATALGSELGAATVGGRSDHAARETASTTGAGATPTVVPTTPESRPPGEGLGLSIVKRLCELLDASLELDSVPGTGTRFRVLLPRSYEA